MNDNVLKILDEFQTFFEGKRYKAYQDGAGIWTCGLGHVKDVTEDTIADDALISQWHRDDLHDADMRVVSMVKVPLDDNQYACMVDIGYNLSYHSSVTLSNYLNQNFDLFKEHLLYYSKDATGNFEKGLLIRRIAERLLFEGRDWTVVKPFQDKSFTVEMILQKQKELFG